MGAKVSVIAAALVVPTVENFAMAETVGSSILTGLIITRIGVHEQQKSMEWEEKKEKTAAKLQRDRQKNEDIRVFKKEEADKQRAAEDQRLRDEKDEIERIRVEIDDERLERAQEEEDRRRADEDDQARFEEDVLTLTHKISEVRQAREDLANKIWRRKKRELAQDEAEEAAFQIKFNKRKAAIVKKRSSSPTDTLVFVKPKRAKIVFQQPIMMMGANNDAINSTAPAQSGTKSNKATKLPKAEPAAEPASEPAAEPAAEDSQDYE